jgi:hypothetical protein
MRDPPIGSMPRDSLESRIIAQVAMFSLNQRPVSSDINEQALTWHEALD